MAREKLRASCLKQDLYVAAKNGNLEIVRLLLEAAADKGAPTEAAAGALRVAAENGRLEVVGLLLEAGAGKDAAVKGGATALSIAAENGHVDAPTKRRRRA